MSLTDALIKEIEPVAEYFAMLFEYTKAPVAFNFTAQNGKKYVLVVHEAREEEPAQEPEAEIVDEPVDE